MALKSFKKTATVELLVPLEKVMLDETKYEAKEVKATPSVLY